MTRPRAADDFATIRARLEELRRENARAAASEREVSSGADAPLSERERRQKERRQGYPPPWAPTVFAKPSGSRR